MIDVMVMSGEVSSHFDSLLQIQHFARKTYIIP